MIRVACGGEPTRESSPFGASDLFSLIEASARAPTLELEKEASCCDALTWEHVGPRRARALPWALTVLLLTFALALFVTIALI